MVQVMLKLAAIARCEYMIQQYVYFFCIHYASLISTIILEHWELSTMAQ